MGNRVTSVRIKRPDGTYSNEIPISPSADKVIWKDNEHNLEEILGNVDTTKPIQNQINQKVNTAELQEYIDTELAGDVDDWLEEHITIPDEAYTLDDTLSTATSAAPAKTVGDIVHESIAPKFSSLLDYKIGDYVFYENHFYKFIEDHVAGAWNATHVEVADDLAKQISTKAEQDGYYSDMTVGDAEQLVATEFIEDDELYTFRKAGGNYDIGNRQYDQLEGGSIVWNQLMPELSSGNWSNESGVTSSFSDNVATISSQTANNGIRSSNKCSMQKHLYYARYDVKGTSGVTVRMSVMNSSVSVDHTISASDTFETQEALISQVRDAGERYVYLFGRTNPYTNISFRNVQLFDLTAMFGTEIADYIYSLEQANAGDGVAWFKKYFPKDYYAYNPGSLQSVNVASHDTVGFNQWDEEWELGDYNANNGNTYPDNTRIRTKNYIPVVPGETYYFKSPNNVSFYFYGVDKSYIKTSGHTLIANQEFIIPDNVWYVGFSVVSAYGTIYKNDICINISDPSRNGEYEPYNKHSYPYDSSLQLRGIPKLINGKLTYDGDIYQSNGTVTRKYGIVDLGTLPWEKIDTSSGHWRFQAQKTDVKRASTSGSTPYILCSKYQGITPDDSWVGTSTGITINNASSYILVCDGNYSSASDFKTAMSGVMLVYELETPTTETATPFVYSQEVDSYGTEEYIDAGVLATTRDVSVPVGHHTKYPPNLRDKLQHLPFLADEDGDYYIQQSNKNMTLKKMEGDFENIVAGSAKQLLSDSYVEDTDIYQFRKSANGMAIGERQLVKEITGGSIIWNQLVPKYNSTYTDNGISINGDGTGKVTIIVSTATGYCQKSIGTLPVMEGHKYLSLRGTAYDTISLYFTGTSGGNQDKIFVADSSGNKNINIYVYSTIGDGTYVCYPMLIDLTAMFGSTIADYIYLLEQANAGDGIAFFKSLFPNDYYEYNQGELISVGGLSEHKTVGFNQWDEEWEVGEYNATTGAKSTATDRIRSKNYISVLPNTVYYVRYPSNLSGGIYGYQYDENKNFIRADYNNTTFEFTMRKNTRYFTFNTQSYYGTTYNHDICINLSDPAKNGTYEPYKSNSYPLDSSVELRGIPKLDANNKLYFDGDRYLANGVVERRYGIVDLGTLSWDYDTVWGSTDNKNTFAAVIPMHKKCNNEVIANIICKNYISVSANDLYTGSDKAIASNYRGENVDSYIRIRDTSYSDAATFKTAMSGVMLVYELATPTTEQAQPYQEIQVVDGSGTEEFVTTNLLPPQCTTQYYENMREKLEKLPHTAASQGDYIITQSNGKMSLKPDVSNHKADIDGHYENLTAGTADQLNSNVFVQDSEPYIFRTAGGSANIGDRLEEEIVGGSIVWNQLLLNISNDTYGVVPGNATLIGVENDIISVKASVSNTNVLTNTGACRFNANRMAGHVILLNYMIKTEETSIRTLISDNTIGTLTYDKTNIAPNAWTNISCLFSIGNWTGNFAFYVETRTLTSEETTVAITKPQLFDLTQMFGSTIADYIYSLEQSNQGDGVAFFKSFFPNDYYAYNAGELMSVSGLSEHKTVGFNVWDEEWELGGYHYSDGRPDTSTDIIRSKSTSYIKVIPGQTYYFNTAGKSMTVYRFDANKNYLGYATNIKNQLYTMLSNVHYIRFEMTSAYGTTYNHDICINLPDPAKNGIYEPYKGHSYPLDDSLTLRGIPKLDSNNQLYFDGDRYLANGVVERRYGIVDLGTLGWNYSDGYFKSSGIDAFIKRESENTDIPNAICTKYKPIQWSTTVDKSIYVLPKNYTSTLSSFLWVKDSDYSDATAFKTAVSGVYLIYEFATPTTEQATPFTSPQIVDNFGTEEYIINTEDDVIVPVGHNTKYPADLKSKLEMVPESPNGNGDYIVRQTDGTNTYVPLVIPSELPTLPTENGNYILKVTVDGTTKTLSWVAQS